MSLISMLAEDALFKGAETVGVLREVAAEGVGEVLVAGLKVLAAFAGGGHASQKFHFVDSAEGIEALQQ